MVYDQLKSEYPNLLVVQGMCCYPDRLQPMRKQHVLCCSHERMIQQCACSQSNFHTWQTCSHQSIQVLSYFSELTILAILFNINTSRIFQDLFALSESALMTCCTFVLQGLIELSLKLVERFPLTSELVDHPISLGCTCMPPSLHSLLQSSACYYYLHRCFLTAFYLQGAVEEQVHKTASHSFKIYCFCWNAFKKSTN